MKRALDRNIDNVESILEADPQYLQNVRSFASAMPDIEKSPAVNVNSIGQLLKARKSGKALIHSNGKFQLVDVIQGKSGAFLTKTVPVDSMVIARMLNKKATAELLIEAFSKTPQQAKQSGLIKRLKELIGLYQKSPDLADAAAGGATHRYNPDSQTIEDLNAQAGPVQQ